MSTTTNIVKLVIFAYPLYATHKAIVTKENLQFWMHTWSVLGLFKATTTVLDKLLFLGEPVSYASLKLGIYIALVYFKCGDTIYTNYLAPFFFSHRAEISEKVSSVFSSLKLNILNKLHDITVALGNEVLRLVLGGTSNYNDSVSYADPQPNFSSPSSQQQQQYIPNSNQAINVASQILSSMFIKNGSNTEDISMDRPKAKIERQESEETQSSLKRQLSLGPALLTAGLNLWSRSSTLNRGSDERSSTSSKATTLDLLNEEKEIEKMEEEYFGSLDDVNLTSNGKNITLETINKFLKKI